MAIAKHTEGNAISCMIFRDVIQQMVKKCFGITWLLAATVISPNIMNSSNILITSNDPTVFTTFPSMNVSDLEMAQKIKSFLIKTCKDYDCKLKWGTVDGSVNMWNNKLKNSFESFEIQNYLSELLYVFILMWLWPS